MKDILARAPRRRFAAGAAGIALALLGACESPTDTLLEATDPDLINPSDVQSAEGALALHRGALSRFRQITAGSGGEGSTWLSGGLLADEWSTSSTFVQNDETDQRSIQFNNGTVTGMYRDLSRARTSANQALALMREFRPTETTRMAELYLIRGFAEMQLASDFCNGVVLSDGTGTEITYGEPKPVADIFRVAVSSLDSAINLATGSDTASLNVNRAAKVIKARAQLGLNLIAEAGATVNGIPTNFAYNVTYAPTSGDNTLWAQPNSASRYTVGDSLEGNGRNLLVRNAIPFFSARDPRLPVNYLVSANGRDTTKAQDGLTFVRKTTMFARSSTTPVANGLDARLIEAEARLKAGDAAGMLSILNALRAAPPRLIEVQPPVMPALADPGNADARINLLFREKAFWTFSRGQRLGDLRRLIRQYGRTAANTFPVGVHYRGGNYGVDVNLPVPQAEQNNPNVGTSQSTCIDRNA